MCECHFPRPSQTTTAPTVGNMEIILKNCVSNNHETFIKCTTHSKTNGRKYKHKIIVSKGDEDNSLSLKCTNVLFAMILQHSPY